MSEEKPSSNYFLIILESLSESSLERPLTLKEIVDSFGTRCHSLLIIFLILPFLQPIPLVGLSTPLGAMIVIVSFLQLLKKNPWIPKRWQNKEIPSKLLIKIHEIAKKFFGKISKSISPRWSFVFGGMAFDLINFLVVAILAILLALPLPVPFTNTVPAIGIFLNGVGYLEKDGALVVLSYIVFLIALVFFGAIGFGVFAGADSLLS